MLYAQSKQWTKAPSEILRIENDYVAYCLDEAIWWFGNYVEDEVAKASKSRGKNDTERKQQMRANSKFRQILGQPMQFAETKASD